MKTNKLMAIGLLALSLMAVTAPTVAAAPELIDAAPADDLTTTNAALARVAISCAVVFVWTPAGGAFVWVCV
jgi:hypothetical protein